MVQTIESVPILAEIMRVNFYIQEIQNCKEAQKKEFNPNWIFHILLNGKYIMHRPGGMRDIKNVIEKVSD